MKFDAFAIDPSAYGVPDAEERALLGANRIKRSGWRWAQRCAGILALALAAIAGAQAQAQPQARTDPVGEPLRVVFDLDVGEVREISLRDGSDAIVRLIQVEEDRDSAVRALERSRVTLEVNGERAVLESGNYNLPVEVGGVQVDVPVTRGYLEDAHVDWWELKKAARVRLWPAGAPWIEPGDFVYPVNQPWFASTTWYSNEPVSRRPTGVVYYHAGMDIGAVEGLMEVYSATDGEVVSVGDDVLAGLTIPGGRAPRYDVVYIRDGRGWYYRYSHLKSFDPRWRPGVRVRKGERLGYVGKEGSSGGWSHLHFEIVAPQPSGLWAMEDAYAYLWQAYREAHAPPVIAVARPHRKVLVGESVVLDASKSWAQRGIAAIDWTLSDGSSAAGPKVERIYETPGAYSEVVRVTDRDGNVSYDFATVYVFPEPVGPEGGLGPLHRVHAAFAPGFGIRPGDPVVFASRGRGTPPGEDLIDFGDGSPPVRVPSNLDPSTHAVNGYGMTVHHFSRPGRYLVTVQRQNPETGWHATQHLQVVVEEEAP